MRIQLYTTEPLRRMFFSNMTDLNRMILNYVRILCTRIRFQSHIYSTAQLVYGITPTKYYAKNWALRKENINFTLFTSKHTKAQNTRQPHFCASIMLK